MNLRGRISPDALKAGPKAGGSLLNERLEAPFQFGPKTQAGTGRFYYVRRARAASADVVAMSGVVQVALGERIVVIGLSCRRVPVRSPAGI